jgi:hypothetical protein
MKKMIVIAALIGGMLMPAQMMANNNNDRKPKVENRGNRNEIRVSKDKKGGKKGDFYPGTVVALWGQTSLADPRLTFYSDRIHAKYLPISDYFKLGVYCPNGVATLESKGQKLTMGFAAPDIRTLPDQGCNFELYMHKMFLEMESLGPVTAIAPGECASHWETWKLERI